MKILSFRNGIARTLVALAALLALNGGLMAGYDFDQAWEDVRAAERKCLPRTVTNLVAEIEREAT